jgi:hypothetical protein
MSEMTANVENKRNKRWRDEVMKNLIVPLIGLALLAVLPTDAQGARTAQLECNHHVGCTIAIDLAPNERPISVNLIKAYSRTSCDGDFKLGKSYNDTDGGYGVLNVKDGCRGLFIVTIEEIECEPPVITLTNVEDGLLVEVTGASGPVTLQDNGRARQISEGDIHTVLPDAVFWKKRKPKNGPKAHRIVVRAPSSCGTHGIETIVHWQQTH